MIPLQSTALALVALGAVALVLTRDTARLVIVASFYGLTLGILFVVFQAPDVALSALVVGAVAFPLVLAVAVSCGRRK